MADSAPQSNWIGSAIKHPGALRATAKRMGLISGGQALSRANIERLARSTNKTTARRARFAEELRGFHHRSK